MNYDLLKKEVKESIFKESKTDDIGLWEIIGIHIKPTFNQLNDNQIKNITLEIIKELLDEKKIVAGKFRNETNKPYDDKECYLIWNLDTNKTIDYIDKEWSKMNRRIDPGDIIQFTARENIFQN